MIKKLTPFILVLLIATGCAETGVYLAEAHALDVEVIKTVSSAYCKLPHTARLMNRARWNAAMSPNTIELTCVSDKLIK
jgi:hypothetical protein